jgi:hypothetical protein
MLKERTLPARNPFGISTSKIENELDKYLAKDHYEDLETRTKIMSEQTKQKIDDAIQSLRTRLKDCGVLVKDNFGILEWIPFHLLDINTDNQRDVDWEHVAHIIRTFDPRAVQVVNVIRLPNGRYSIPEGQHTAVVLYILWLAGIIEKDFLVQCKVIDSLAVVPGSDIKGEAFGNYLFRVINHKGRKAVAEYYMHKSRVSGVRNYGSTLLEDIHAEHIQTIVEKNNMYTRPAAEGSKKRAKPGMITYITGLNSIAELESLNFNISINDLDFALGLHDRYFANEKGVDGGFILALGRYGKLARKNKITITREWQDALMKFFKETYASPSKFHNSAKKRLKKFNTTHDLPGGWSDNCLLSILILDFYKWCDANNVNYPALPDKHINKFQGI